MKVLVKLCLLFNLFVLHNIGTPQEGGWNKVTIQERFLKVTLRSVHTIGLDFGIVVGDSGTILKTKDGGTTWTAPPSGTNDDLLSVFFPNDTLGFAVGGLFNSRGSFVKTTDGGDTWTAQEGIAPNLLFASAFLNDSTGFASGVNGTLIGTSNGGNSWAPQPSGTSNWLLGMSPVFLRGDTIPSFPIFGVGGNGTIVRKKDPGAGWSPLPSGTSEWLTSVTFLGDSFGVAVGNLGTIIGTLDTGESWWPWSSGTQSDLTDVTYLPNATAIAVGHNGTILNSLDLGKTWTPQFSLTLKNLLGVSFFDNNFGMAVGDSGTVLVTRTGGLVVSVQEDPGIKIPVKFQLYQNYPNPFNPETVIRYDLQQQQKVEISIFNLLGQKIRALVSKNQPAGSYQIKWNGIDDAGNAVSSGVYLYELHAGDVKHSKKMLLLQ